MKKKRIGKKSARISTDGTLFKKVNEKNAKWLKNNVFLNDDDPVEKVDVGESINLKKTSGVSVTAKKFVKKYRNLARKKPYGKRPSTVVVKDNNDPSDIIDLEDIAMLRPNKNAQVAAKKISKKYKNICNRKTNNDDNIDFTITDSRPADDDIDFTVTVSRPADDDDIDFTVTESRPVDDDDDFTVTESRPADDDIDFNVTDSRVANDESDVDFNITSSAVNTNKNLKKYSKNISKKCRDIRRRKELKLLNLAAIRDQENNDQTSKKNLLAPDKKVSDKCKKLRRQKNVDLVADIQKTLTNKNARIAAQKISEKYKKFRRNKLKKPVILTNNDDADTVAYDENTDLRDVLSIKGAQTAANKISKEYKKMNAKTQSFPFNLSDRYC